LRLYVRLYVRLYSRIHSASVSGRGARVDVGADLGVAPALCALRP
jgi:hypothetical protein